MADFVTKYIDLILLGAIAIAIVPTVYHYIKATLKARKNRNAPLPSSDDLVLDESLFDQDKTNDAK